MLYLGILLSIAAHGSIAFCVLLLLAEPKPFAAAPEQAITVEIITPSEAKQAEGASGSPQQSQQTEPPVSAPAAIAREPEQPAPSSTFSAFDPATMTLYNMRPESGAGFDARADRAADLKREDILAFKAQLRRCWRLPDGLTPHSSVRVVLRASFTRDGALLGEPALVEATASKEGPAIYRAAMQALTQCGPYRSLPRERYTQWKVLDISFSPREMSGG